MKRMIWNLLLLSLLSLLSSYVSAKTYFISLQHEQKYVALLKIKTHGEISLQQAIADVNHEVELDLFYDPDSFPHNSGNFLPLHTAIPVLLNHLNNVNSEGSLCVGEVCDHAPAMGPPPTRPDSWEQDSINATIPHVVANLGYQPVTQQTQALYIGQVPLGTVISALPAIGFLPGSVGSFSPIQHADNEVCKKANSRKNSSRCKKIVRDGREVYPCLHKGCENFFTSYSTRTRHHRNHPLRFEITEDLKIWYICPNCDKYKSNTHKGLYTHMSGCKE